MNEVAQARHPVEHALAVGAFQLVGSFGAAQNQPDRKSIDALAVLLVMVGPIALTVRDRWPLVTLAAAVSAADIYIGFGYPYGPIFVSAAFALFAAVQAGQRRPAAVLAAIGYVGYIIATQVDPNAEDDAGLVHFALVAGWLAMLLTIAELVRVRRAHAAERQRAAEDDERRRVSEQRLTLAQELHDVLAHNISLINVQASVALHLIDDRPEQAKPALLNIKVASHDALQELRTALDVLRYGEDAPRAPVPNLADLDSLVDGVRAGGLEVRHGDRRTGAATSGRDRACRVSHRAGSSHQRDAARQGEEGHRSLGIRRWREHRSARRWRGRSRQPRATAFAECANARSLSAARSTPARGPAAASELQLTSRAASHDHRRHR